MYKIKLLNSDLYIKNWGFFLVVTAILDDHKLSATSIDVLIKRGQPFGVKRNQNIIDLFEFFLNF